MLSPSAHYHKHLGVAKSSNRLCFPESDCIPACSDYTDLARKQTQKLVAQQWADKLHEWSNDIKAVAEMNGVAPFGVCDLVGFRLGWAPLGLGWEHSWGEGRTQWVTRKGKSTSAIAFIMTCWPFYRVSAMAWAGVCSSPCMLLEILSSGSLHAGLFVQLFWWHNLTKMSWGKISLSSVLELKFSVYRQINLTELANFRFHIETEVSLTEVCMVALC